jgi:chromosome segregation ATPase
MGKENGPSMRATPSTDTPLGPSLVNVIMLYLSILGLGVIGGYGVFFYMFSERCVNLLQESDVRFNTSREEWQAKYREALTEKEQCIIPLNEMQGRLEAQSTLAEHHQALLGKHEDTVAKLAALQQSKQESSAALEKMETSHKDLILNQEDTLAKLRDSNSALENLRTQMGELEVELQRANQRVTVSAQEKEGAEKELENQKSIADEKWAKQENELVALKRSHQATSHHLEELKTQVERAEQEKRDSNNAVEKLKTQVAELQSELERAKQSAETRLELEVERAKQQELHQLELERMKQQQAENPQAAS